MIAQHGDQCGVCRGTGETDDPNLTAGTLRCSHCRGSGVEPAQVQDMQPVHEVDDIVPIPSRRQRRAAKSKKKGAAQSFKRKDPGLRKKKL